MDYGTELINRLYTLSNKTELANKWGKGTAHLTVSIIIKYATKHIQLVNMSTS